MADSALGLQAEDLTESPSGRLATVIVLRLSCWNRKPSVVRRQIFFFQILVGGLVAIDPFPPQFLDQPILMGPVVPLHPPLGLGRTGGDDPNASFWHMRPNCVTGILPRIGSAVVAFRLCTFFQSG